MGAVFEKVSLRNTTWKHCKAPLDVIAHKVSTSYIYIYIYNSINTMHAFNSPDLFSRKSGFWGKNRGTTTVDTMFASLSWRTKKTPEENLKVRYINIFIYSQFLLLLIYINTFPLTFIEDSMVEGKSHTTWPTESNSRDHSRIS